MAEFKFSCPQCGQHIQCDTGYSGAQINCPSCQQAIVVPQAPRFTAAPTAPPGLSTRQSTTVPATGRRFPGAPGAQPPAKPKSKALRTVLVITAVVVVLAGLGAGLWFGIPKYKAHKAAQAAKKGNPAAQVPAPSATAATGALGILDKMVSAYTNATSYSADIAVNLSIDLSRITAADLNPNAPPNARNPQRRPPGMPTGITNTTELSMKRAKPMSFRIAGDAKTQAGRGMNMTNTFAFWSSGSGIFMFMDPHQRGARPTYTQLPDNNAALGMNGQTGLGIANPQQFFGASGMLTKVIKDLGQTGDEPVNGQDCYTLTAKVLGQKLKVWVNTTSYLVMQWELTLGGAISDADIDDAFAVFIAAAGTNAPPPGQLEMIKAQMKQAVTPVIPKLRGTITATYNNIEVNQTYAAADFDYTVPQGVRLTRLPGAATPAASSTAASTSREASQRNACINNLRQIDGAKNEWALEKRKQNGTAVTEADITPYIKGGVLPKCPGGGKYTIGKVGELPTCSIAGHALP